MVYFSIMCRAMLSPPATLVPLWYLATSHMHPYNNMHTNHEPIVVTVSNYVVYDHDTREFAPTLCEISGDNDEVIASFCFDIIIIQAYSIYCSCY